MKKMKKYFALFVALAMVLGTMSLGVFAAATAASGEGGTASIQITLPTDNAGTDNEITYHVYKVFDATQSGTAISYKIDATNGALTSAMTNAGFFVDDGGNVHYGTFTADPDPLPAGQTPGTYFVNHVRGTITDKGELDQTALDAIKLYATDEVGNGSGFKAKPSDGTLTITELEYGYYYITTTTGTVVTVDSTNPNAEVSDKNDIPKPPVKTIVEDFEGSVDNAGKNAIAQVGTTVPFSVDIVKVKGAENYVFHDVMDDGLAYDSSSLEVYTVTKTGEGDEATETENKITKSATTWNDAPLTSGDTLTVTFVNSWLSSLADNTTIRIKYSAKVTSNALSVDYANNTATLNYGEGNTTDKDEVKVYNAKFTVTKQDGKGTALANAGFVIKNASGAYYKLTSTTIGEDDDAVTTYIVSWYELTEGETLEAAIAAGKITEYKSDNTGAVPAFTGLKDGTYTLVESTVPAGYNKAADSTFTIAQDNYTEGNLAQTSTVVNESGAELPSTGGIGTTIFYVLGTILVLAAGVLLVTRRRMRHSEE